MTSDPVERLLDGIDRPLPPRPEFAEALLDRLLVELEPEAGRERDPGEQSQEDPMIPVTASCQPPPRCRSLGHVWALLRCQQRRRGATGS
jgi:hypothetical protein